MKRMLCRRTNIAVWKKLTALCLLASWLRLRAMLSKLRRSVR